MLLSEFKKLFDPVIITLEKEGFSKDYIAFIIMEVLYKYPPKKENLKIPEDVKKNINKILKFIKNYNNSKRFEGEFNGLV